MKGLVKSALVGGLLLAASSAFAQDAEEPQLGWTGKGEFGFVSTTGNTDSRAINLNLQFVKTTEKWRHRFSSTALVTEEDGVQDNERYTFEAQSDRKFSEISYIFGALRWDADKFGAYDPQQTITVGYGRHLMQSEKQVLKGEIGAGYRNLEERVSGEKSKEAIVRLLLDHVWQILPSTEWANRLLVETGSTNTFSQFNTGLNVAMNERFAVKLGFEARHNTKVPPGDSENTDTTTTVNLVYNF